MFNPTIFKLSTAGWSEKKRRKISSYFVGEGKSDSPSNSLSHTDIHTLTPTYTHQHPYSYTDRGHTHTQGMGTKMYYTSYPRLTFYVTVL